MATAATSGISFVRLEDAFPQGKSLKQIKAGLVNARIENKSKEMIVVTRKHGIIHFNTIIDRVHELSKDWRTWDREKGETMIKLVKKLENLSIDAFKTILQAN